MTATNSTLLAAAPFTSHTAFTLWRLDPDRGDPTKKPIKVPVHFDGVTRHDLGNDGSNGKPVRPPNPAPPLTAELAQGWQAAHHANNPACAIPNQVGYIGTGFRPEGTGLVCIDLDGCIGPDGWAPGAVALFARFPGALIEQSTSGTGAHIWVSVTGPGPGRKGKQTTPLGDVEVYGGGQFIACGTVLGGDASTDHTEAVAALVAEFWPAAVPRTGEITAADWDSKTPEQQQRTLADLASALTAIDPDNRDEWVSMGQALQSLGETGYRLWADWSATSTRFPGGDGLDKWDGFSGERTDYRAVFSRAEATGRWTNPARRADPLQTFAVAAVELPAGALTERPAGYAPPTTQDRPSGMGGLSIPGATDGKSKSNVHNIMEALRGAGAQVTIALDNFTGQINIAVSGGPFRAFKQTDYTRLRAAIEKHWFTNVSAGDMKDSVAAIAEENAYDSAIDWAQAQVWDGVERIDTALPRYYRTEDTPYTRAMGAYLFTGLAGRCLVPGIKADMMIVFVGLQGARKTTAVKALSPLEKSFGELDLDRKDDELTRSMQGKLVLELAELKGLSGRGADAVKAWISRQVDSVRPLFQNFYVDCPRRSLIIGTDNPGEFLDDPTGARRFLPTRVGDVDADALIRDRDQLWAEGIARFRASGIAWQEAERLAKEEHHKFESGDIWTEAIEKWLSEFPKAALMEIETGKPRSEGRVSSAEIATSALRLPVHAADHRAKLRISKIMNRLGYKLTVAKEDHKSVKLWYRP